MIQIPTFTADCTEMDVRERLITPLLNELGYTEEEVMRERKLMLGSGTVVYPDYIIETDRESDYNLPSNRLVIEAKRPTIPLTNEVLDQAVSYSSHRLVD